MWDDEDDSYGSGEEEVCWKVRGLKDTINVEYYL